MRTVPSTAVVHEPMEPVMWAGSSPSYIHPFSTGVPLDRDRRLGHRLTGFGDVEHGCDLDVYSAQVDGHGGAGRIRLAHVLGDDGIELLEVVERAQIRADSHRVLERGPSLIGDAFKVVEGGAHLIGKRFADARAVDVQWSLAGQEKQVSDLDAGRVRAAGRGD